MRSWLWPSLLLAPMAANAQSLAITLGNNADAGFANATECATVETVNYTATLTTSCSDLNVWATAGSCGNAPDAGDLTVGTVTQANLVTPANRSGFFQFTVSDLPLIDGGCGGAVEVNYTLCGAFQPPSFTGCVTDTAFVKAALSPTFRYDGVPPGVPTIKGVGSLDSALTLDLGLTLDTTQVTVQYRQAGDAGDGTWLKGGTFLTGSRVEVDGLQNAVTYEVRAQAEDGAGNDSDFSDPTTGTPQALLGFWDQYRADGGQDAGGCTQVGGHPIWLFAAVPAALSWLRRRRR